MFNRIFFKLILIGVFGLLLGCVTSDKPYNGFSPMQKSEISKLDNKKNSRTIPKEVEFFVVAKLKSVNKQPGEYLEFKNKRFLSIGDCQTWINDNHAMLNDSLHKHLMKRKKGYFVDVVNCYKTTSFILKTGAVSYEI